MNSLNVFIGCGLLLLLCVSYTTCCTCVPKHPQTAFCRSQFVIKAVVLSDRKETKMEKSLIFESLGIPSPVFVHYNVLITKVYRGIEQIQNLTESNSNTNIKIPIHTSQYGATCGVELKKNKKYLISGRIFKGQLQINHCDWISEFYELSTQVKHGLHGKFDCTCQVGTCINGYCDIPHGCKWKVQWDQPADECTQNHRYCEKVSESCQWSKKNSDFEKCKLSWFPRLKIASRIVKNQA